MTELVAAIRTVAEAQQKAEGAPAEVTGSEAWNALVRRLEGSISGYSPGNPAALAAMEDVARAAAVLLEAENLYERHASYRTFELILHTLGRDGDGEAAEPYRALLYERMSHADDKERAAIASTIAASASPSAGRFLTHVVETEKLDSVRAAAIQGLDACSSERCFPDPEAVSRWTSSGDPGSARSAAIALAGRLHVTSIVEGCADNLGAGFLAPGCRAGLARLRTEPAFKALDAWLAALLESPAGRLPDVGEAVGFIVPYADLPFAASRVAALLHTAITDGTRDLKAAATIARMVGWIPDRAEARKTVKKALSVWRGVLADRPASEAEHVGRVIEALETVERGLLTP